MDLCPALPCATCIDRCGTDCAVATLNTLAVCYQDEPQVAKELAVQVLLVRIGSTKVIDAYRNLARSDR